MAESDWEDVSNSDWEDVKPAGRNVKDIPESEFQAKNPYLAVAKQGINSLRNAGSNIAHGIIDPPNKLIGYGVQGLNKAITGKEQPIDLPFTGRVNYPTNRDLTAETLKTGSLALNPIAGGALYGGAQAYGNKEDVGGIAKNTAIGGALGFAGERLMNGELPTRKTPEEKFNEFANVHREVLAPSKSEINKVEVKSGKDLNDSYKLAVKEGLVYKKSGDGKTLDTSEARQSLQPKINTLHEQADNILNSDTQKQFDLEKIGKTVKSSLRKNIKNDSDYEDAIKLVDKEIGSAINQRGDLVNAQQLNDIKEGMWSKSYDPLNPNANKTARQIGFVAKDTIEKAFPDKNLKEINAERGKFLTLQTLLENAHGRVINKGKIGRYAAQVIGSLGLSHIPHVGPLLGGYLGGKVSDVMSNPERITGNISKKVAKMALNRENVSNAGTVTPEIFGAPQYLNAPAQRPTQQPIDNGVISGENPIKGLQYNPAEIKQRPFPQEFNRGTIYGQNPIMKLPHPSQIGHADLPSTPAQGHGFTVSKTVGKRVGDKSTGYIFRSTPKAEPMKVYVDKDGDHFIYEDQQRKYLTEKQQEKVTFEDQSLSNFNPLKQQPVRNNHLGRVLGVAALGTALIAGNASAQIPKDDEAVKAILGEVGPRGIDGMRWVASAIRNRNNGLKGIYGQNNPNVVNKNYSDKQLQEARQAWEESKSQDFTNGANHWFSDADLKKPIAQKIIREEKLSLIKRIGRNNFYKRRKK